jgi:hypothetical protein
MSSCRASILRCAAHGSSELLYDWFGGFGPHLEQAARLKTYMLLVFKEAVLRRFALL